MIPMKEYWRERLSKIEDLEERRLLRGVLFTAFENLEDYTTTQLEAIKQRVFEENKNESQQIDIYTKTVPINEYDKINDFLYPMNNDDLKELPFDATVITSTMEEGEQPILGKLYFELDYLELQKIIKTLPDRKFQGVLKTNKEDYEIKISLAPYDGYSKQVERLYELHLENNIPWRTLLNPSIYKFMEMRLETEIAFKNHEKIEEIMIDLEELDEHKQINQLPLWNIKTKPFHNQGFSMPAGDEINYEHTLVFEEEKRKLSYLIDANTTENEIINTRMEENRLVLTTPKDSISNWQLWMIITPLESDLTTPNLTSNAKLESFIDNFANRTGRVVRTLGEIYRIAHSFAYIDNLKLSDIKINDQNKEQYETYELNPFLKDEIRANDHKKIMKLEFTAENKTPFTRDMMSFITSEIALYFPEYKCVGELK